MEIRLARDEDTEAVKWLWSYCFEHETDPFFIWYFSNYYKAENTLVGYEQGTLAVSLQLIPYKLFLRGQVIPMSYVVGVDTDPQMRSGGRINDLMREALVEMRRRNHHASILMPFKAGFYYPYQWEICYHHYKYVLSLDDLKPVAAKGGTFMPVRDDQASIDALAEVYHKFVQGRHGYVVRSKDDWQAAIGGLFAESGFCYLVMLDGSPSGYVMYTIQQKRIVVREMAYSGQEAQQKLFYFLYNHRSQVSQVEWNAPLDDTTAFSLFDPKQDIRFFPFMTGRIVDVAKLLTAIGYPAGAKGKLVFHIDDGSAEWNEKDFVLTVADGRGTVVAESDQAPDFRCSVGALTQLVFGRLSVLQLVSMNRMLVNNREAIDLLDVFFPVCNNYINEYY